MTHRCGPSENPIADLLKDLNCQMAVEGYDRWRREDIRRPVKAKRTHSEIQTGERA